MMRRIATIVVCAAVAAGLAFIAPTVASASDNPPPGTVGHRQFTWNGWVEIVGVRVNQLNPDYIAKCGVDSPGQKCTIARTDTLTREISAEYGVSSDLVAGAIGVSASQSVSIQTGCTSPEMRTSEEYIAYPTETRYYYRVVTDDRAYVTDLGEYMPSGEWTASPIAYSAAYDKGFRCRVQPQPAS